MFSRIFGVLGNQPGARLLAWRIRDCRSVSSLGLRFTASNPVALHSAATKTLETFEEEFDVGSKKITNETGKIARLANVNSMFFGVHANQPGGRLHAWRIPGCRTVSSLGLGSTASNPDALHSAGTKILETFEEEFEVGSKKITIETGKMARFANGAVVLSMGDTKVLSTVTSAKDDCVRDFLPLTVDYQEKQFAKGVIPSSYMRREGAPKERELLCGRIIDRPIRPLFPAGFYHEVQVMSSVLSSDGKQDPDVMAANATSAALMLSDIPWNGPIGVVRIGRIEGCFVVNPTMEELDLSDLNLIYACTKDKTLMIDVHAREISERDLEAALRFAHPEAVKYIEPQCRLAAKSGKRKRNYKLYLLNESTLGKVRDMAESAITAVFTDESYGKFERGEALDKITQDVKKKLQEEGDEEILKVLPKAIDTVRKQVVRTRIINEGVRVDGRRLDEVRPLYCEAGILPVLHGSSLFSRGETQTLCTVTLGAPGDAQPLQSLVGPTNKRFMLHYNFPPFSINEVGKRGGLSRREVGHGTLAEKALLSVLPPEDILPYTVRVNSEVMASDGSTSMASVCGGSMALMDAGIPLRGNVAGISIGLVSETDPTTGEIEKYQILTDILGLEDHLGDMDFKIAGTRNGITAIQLDIKPAGIPLDIICECLEPALKGRLVVLDRMDDVIRAPRSQDNKNAPRIATLKFSNDDLRRLIGPLGVIKAKIEDETGARLSISDGTVTIVAKNESVMEIVQEKVDFTVGRELEIGQIYKGTVSSIKEYGAFIEFNGGQRGLLHISELSHEPVSKISDVLSVGQLLSLMCVGQDVRGNIKLSLKATLPNNKPESSRISDPSSDDCTTDANPKSQVSSSCSSFPAVIIRSVEECDEMDKSSSKVDEEPASNNGMASQCSKKKSRAKKMKSTVSSSPPSEEFEEESEIPSLDEVVEKKTKSPRASNKRKRAAKAPAVVKEAEPEVPKEPKDVKIGMQLNATVHQVRTHGLVLNMGENIRGMYRFEENRKREFKMGDKLRVRCESFSDKGIPVVSLLD